MANIFSIDANNASYTYDSEMKNPKDWDNIDDTLKRYAKGGPSGGYADEAYHAVIADTAKKAKEADLALKAKEADLALKANVALEANSAKEADIAIRDIEGNEFVKSYLKRSDSYTKEEIDSKMVSAYTYKGSVPFLADLPTRKNEVGDMYNVKETGKNYAWDGTEWDELGSEIDLTDYLKKKEADAIYASQASVIEEKNRATRKESELEAKIADLPSKEQIITAEQVDAKIKTETDRAVIEETKLNDKFANYTTTAEQTIKDNSLTEQINIETQRAIKKEAQIENNISSNYYTKEETTTKIRTDVPNIKVNESVKATKDGNGKIISSTYSTKEELQAETKRATNKENAIINKFANYTETSNVPNIKVNESVKADNATRAISDEKGNNIFETYATKQEVEAGGSAEKIKAEEERAKAKELELENKFANYTETVNIPSIKVNEALKSDEAKLATRAVDADNATKASLDSVGDIIVDKYATKANTYTREEIDQKVSSVYTYKGSVKTYVDLPKDIPVGTLAIGDVYNVEDSDMNYAWNGTAWDALGGAVDLSSYLKKEDAVKTYATKSALEDEVQRATNREDTIINKFDNYTETSLISKIVVDEAKHSESSNSATNAVNDTNGNQINLTYATNATLELETNRAMGVEDGFETRITALEAGGGGGGGTGPDLKDYYTKKQTDAEIKKEETRAIARETEIENTFNDYTLTSNIPLIKVNEAKRSDKAKEANHSATSGSAKEATKAIQDGNGNVIADTYATIANTYDKAAIDEKISSVYKYKGSVKTYLDLPKDEPIGTLTVGDVYDVREDDSNYAWDGKKWDKLGGTINLSEYLKTTDAASTYATQIALETETNRAKGEEEKLLNNFSNFTPTVSIPTIKVTNAELADSAIKATQDGDGNVIVDTYAKKSETYTTAEVNENIRTESQRAIKRENEIDGKFINYTETSSIPDIKVNEAVSADSATKATQDGNGNVITETYATIANTYDKATIDEKLTAVYKYKGSVANYDSLPKEGQIVGDVWNTIDTGDNYAWTSEKAWDKLGGTINLEEYLKATDAASTYATISSVEAETNRAKGEEERIDAKFADYQLSSTALKLEDVKKEIGTETTRATAREDEIDRSITEEVGRATARENEIDGKFANYITSAIQLEKDNAQDQALSKEVERALAAEKVLEEKINAGGGGGGGELPTDSYYTKTEIDEKLKNEVPTIKVNNATEADKAIQDGLGNVIATTYALKSEIISADTVDSKILTETNRAKGEEEKINAKFADYATTASLADATVSKAGTADSATKATQDSDGNVIVDTYAKKVDTYTIEQIDAKLTAVYKYKGSVTNYDSLPKDGQTKGDVYNVEDTGDNYAWNGTEWDKLGGTINLEEYLKSSEAAATYATISSVEAVDSKFADYATTASLTNAKVAEATKATQDAAGNVIVDTYATKLEAVSEEAVDKKVKIETDRAVGAENSLSSKITTLENKGFVTSTEVENSINSLVPTIKVNNATEADKAIQDGLGNVIADTYATIENTYDKKTIDTKLTAVYKYKGSVANYDSLPKTEQIAGDVYNVEDTGDNYAWNGTTWDKLGGTVNLEEYLKKAEAAATYATPGSVDVKLADYVKTVDLKTASVKKADEATKATQDGNGAVIADTYATIASLADATVLKAGTADEATKATQDGAGNVIDTTYAKDTEFKAEVQRATKAEGDLADRVSAIEAGGGGGPAPDLKEYLKKTEAATTYATISSVETVDGKFKDYATTASLANAKVAEATKATQDGKGNVIENTYATQDALNVVDGKFADYATSESLSAYATTESLAAATVKKAGTADSATKATQDGDGNVISLTYVKTNDLTTASVKKAESADSATKATQDGAGNVITDTYATIANTYDKETIDTKLTAVYVFKGSVANYDALPKEGQTAGDVYDTLDTGTNYAWTGDKWDALGGSSVDLSAYLKTEDAAKTYATQDALNNVDSKFAGYTPSTDIHSIIVDTATKAMQDGNGAIITDTYATIDSLSTATVAKSGETDSITNVTATEGPWKINFNPKGAANNPANFLWFDAKNNQIKNANTKSLNVNHALKATQDEKGNVIDTFYAKGADLTALDERVTAIEAGGGGGTGPDLKDYYKKSETYSQAEVNDAIKVETDRATGVEGGLETRVAALEAGGGGGTGPDLTAYLKKADAEKTYATIQTVNGIDDRVKKLEAGGGGGGGTSGGDYVLAGGYEATPGQGLDCNALPKSCIFVIAADWDKIQHSPKTQFGNISGNSIGGAFIHQFSCGKDYVLQEIHTLAKSGSAQCFTFHRSKVGGQWTNWVKTAYNEW